MIYNIQNCNILTLNDNGFKVTKLLFKQHNLRTTWVHIMLKLRVTMVFTQEKNTAKTPKNLSLH